MAQAEDLQKSPSKQLKVDILEAFWRTSTIKYRGGSFNEDIYRQYFEQYYFEQVAMLHDFGTVRLASKMAATTHQHVIGIVKLLWVHKARTRSEICQKVKTAIFEDEVDDSKIGHAIDFAMRLWLLINVRGPDIDYFIPAEGPARAWKNDSTLNDFVANRFPDLDTHVDNIPNAALTDGSNFTAVQLRKVGGFQILWTRNIEEHLRIHKANPRTLRIYPYRVCLESQLLCKAPIPSQVLEDTLLSLAILFPDWDSETTEFLRKEGYASLSEASYPRDVVYINDFKVWRRRINELYQAYQEPPVKLFADRRNIQQYFTFWSGVAVVIFTVAFGIITMVTSCLSTNYARLTYQLAAEAAKSPPCVSLCPMALPTQLPETQYLKAYELRV